MKHWTMVAGAALAVSTATVAAPALASSQTAPTASSQTALPALSRTAPLASSRTAPVAGAVYLGYRGSKVEVLTHRRGWSSLAMGGGALTGQFSASPDGKRIAWIDDKNRLHVKSAGGDRVIAKDALYVGPCVTPAWTADGKRIAYPKKGTATATTVIVVGADGRNAVDSGKTIGVCHLTWSANGRTLAGYAGDTRGVYLLDTRLRTSAKARGIKLANHVESLSPNGSRVVVNAIGANAEGGDGSWPLFTNPSIYETSTGRKIPIPVKGRLLGARYLNDGRLAVRVKGAAANTLVILNASGKELQRVTEPARAKNLGLLNVLG
ncbi:TolB family protein [Streptosporangium subroseum]|uniref:TolB family protein n=1 Tax=Streptosporangium subroseum TaxID=106412 RepID=UPI003084D59C|nr:hypothetical protein OHB15_33850 [Streptosporangium subroseum]